MLLLEDELLTSQTSEVFKVDSVMDICIEVKPGDGPGSGFNTTGVVNLEVASDHTNFVNMTSGGADVEFSAGDHHKVIRWGGSSFRFVADATASMNLDIRVQGWSVTV